MLCTGALKQLAGKLVPYAIDIPEIATTPTTRMYEVEYSTSETPFGKCIMDMNPI